MEPLLLISKHQNASDSLTVNITDVILRSELDNRWTFSGLNVYFNHCELDSLQLRFTNHDVHSENTREILTIMITNSSFRSLDLRPETRAEIIDFYIDAQSQSRPTLLKTNNSHIKIQNSQFHQFVNKNGATILDAENHCNQSRHGVLYFHDNSHVEISNTNCQNRVSYSGGAIYVNNYVKLTITNCIFDENSARSYGGAIFAYKATLAINNSTFRWNKLSRYIGEYDNWLGWGGAAVHLQK